MAPASASRCALAASAGGNLFAAGSLNPLDLAAAMKGIGHRVQAVTDESVNTLDAGLGKALDQFFRHGSGHDGHSRR